MTDKLRPVSAWYSFRQSYIWLRLVMWWNQEFCKWEELKFRKCEKIELQKSEQLESDKSTGKIEEFELEYSNVFKHSFRQIRIWEILSGPFDQVPPLSWDFSDKMKANWL